MSDQIKIGLLGNPNAGKTSLFNVITGMRQKVSNFPGVTVDYKRAVIKHKEQDLTIIDLPGTYSLHPNSKEEKLIVDILTDPSNPNYPDYILYVCDVNHLERHLLLATQIADLGIPFSVALNMTDIYEGDTPLSEVAFQVEQLLGTAVIPISTRQDVNTGQLIDQTLKSENNHSFYNKLVLTEKIEKILDGKPGTPYACQLIAHHYNWLGHLTSEQQNKIAQILDSSGFQNIQEQINDTFQRFEKINAKIITQSSKKIPELTDRIDKIVTHKLLGPTLFLGFLLLVFQAIFAWSEAPMGWIENGFGYLAQGVNSLLGENWLTSLINDGLIAGLAGVLVFVPQIAILFFLISLLEESGYMSRAVYLFDPLMRRFGLNGRSMVALVSSGACAIPAIMSTRTISNWKERLITIMVSPLISCSARIPVYSILVSFVVPPDKWGPFNLQGLVFMGLYLLGIVGALFAAIIFKKVLKSDEPSYLMIELPQYKKPLLKNVFYIVKSKVMTFIIEAGKIILIISMILWLGASYGPGEDMKLAEQEAKMLISVNQLVNEEAAELIRTKKLEQSYIGHIGKWIEPAIEPLGFDWKIGIALVTSFAAREVFVGTMSTLYSIGGEDESLLKEKMAKQHKKGTSIKQFNPATAMSLLVFYVFAMQCMSTLAITKRETNSWKYPIIQFAFMGILAYLGSLITYQLMS